MRLLTFTVLCTSLVLVTAAPFPLSDALDTRNSNGGEDISTGQEINLEPLGQPKIKSRVLNYGKYPVDEDEDEVEEKKVQQLQESLRELSLKVNKMAKVSCRS